MKYLHTMIRTSNLVKTIDFYCDKLGLIETKRYDNSKGRFSLVFLCAPDDFKFGIVNNKPLIEITYNWPSEDGKIEVLKNGRNFGHIAFAVNDIYETCEKLMKKNIVINRPPRDGHMAFIKSPENISIELLQKGEPKEVMKPWSEMQNIGEW